MRSPEGGARSGKTAAIAEKQAKPQPKSINVTSKKGEVIMEFAKSVDWISMSPKQARELAQLLQIRAVLATRVK